MPPMTITPAQRRTYRADAHHLDPVVLIGANGLTAGVLKEIDTALNAHGLIKVRVCGADRLARESIFSQLADTLNAAAVQHIGRLLVLWRPPVDRQKVPDEARKPGPREVKVLKFSQRAGQKPEVKRLRVLGNQRLTAGGQLKRAKPRQASIKKRQAP